ncbi:hypothetical protein RJ640_018891, partial [Escallonia rubra]
MKVTEKCDVYSFGVLALEVIKGKHPGDIIPSLTSSSEKLQLKDLVDERLPYLSPKIEEAVKSIIVLARSCLHTNPQSRPTMHNVSQLPNDVIKKKKNCNAGQ